MNITETDRQALIAALAETNPGLGRTALMKFCYLMQVARGVPLGYNFTLYTYGPFDSDVLSDLSSCESMGGVSSSVQEYPGGYGYSISPGTRHAEVKALGYEFVAQYETEIDWVVAEFGRYTASVLELLSTIIYADRELREATCDELVSTVCGVKPRFQSADIKRWVQFLLGKGLLVSVTECQ